MKRGVNPCILSFSCFLFRRCSGLTPLAQKHLCQRKQTNETCTKHVRVEGREEGEELLHVSRALDPEYLRKS